MIQAASDPQRSLSGPTPCRPKISEPFNPWHKACGFYPPDVVARQHDLTDGQKRLYDGPCAGLDKTASFGEVSIR